MVDESGDLVHNAIRLQFVSAPTCALALKYRWEICVLYVLAKVKYIRVFTSLRNSATPLTSSGIVVTPTLHVSYSENQFTGTYIIIKQHG